MINKCIDILFTKNWSIRLKWLVDTRVKWDNSVVLLYSLIFSFILVFILIIKLLIGFELLNNLQDYIAVHNDLISKSSVLFITLNYSHPKFLLKNNYILIKRLKLYFYILLLDDYSTLIFMYRTAKKINLSCSRAASLPLRLAGKSATLIIWRE